MTLSFFERDEAQRLYELFRGQYESKYTEWDASKTNAVKAAEAEVARLKEFMACADTPLMRDVLAERDRLRDEIQRAVRAADRGVPTRAIEIIRAALGEDA